MRDGGFGFRQKHSWFVDTLYRRTLGRKLNRCRKSASAPHAEILPALKNSTRSSRWTRDPIGRTPRSNPATYTGRAHGDKKHLLAMLPESKIRWDTGREGSVSIFPRADALACGGSGTVRIEMHFLADVYVIVRGLRRQEGTITKRSRIRYKGKNISDVLEMTISEAVRFSLRISRKFRAKLSVLNEVGLGYVRLGQQVTTLSGGEAQRYKTRQGTREKSHRKNSLCA